MIVSDIDGTLLRRDGSVHPEDRNAIRMLRARGVQVALCTGRMFSGTRELSKELGLLGPVACVDGAHIADVASGRTLTSAPLSHETISDALSVMATSVGVAFAFAGDQLVHQSAAEEVVRYLRAWSPRMVETRSFLEAEWARAVAVHGLGWLGGESDVGRISRELRAECASDTQLFTFRLPFGAEPRLWGMVLRSTGVSKGTAVEWLASSYGVELSRVVTIGDWLNDIAMLRMSGRSFAMAQAPQEVKAAASMVLRASDETGGGLFEVVRLLGVL